MRLSCLMKERSIRCRRADCHPDPCNGESLRSSRSDPGWYRVPCFLLFREDNLRRKTRKQKIQAILFSHAYSPSKKPSDLPLYETSLKFIGTGNDSHQVNTLGQVAHENGLGIPSTARMSVDTVHPAHSLNIINRSEASTIATRNSRHCKDGAAIAHHDQPAAGPGNGAHELRRPHALAPA